MDSFKLLHSTAKKYRVNLVLDALRILARQLQMHGQNHVRTQHIKARRDEDTLQLPIHSEYFIWGRSLKLRAKTCLLKLSDVAP